MPEPQRLEPPDMAKIPFLAGLLPAEVEALCSAAVVLEFPAGSVIFREGDAGQELYVVIDGEVAIEIDVAGVGRRVLAALRPGTVFGEINYLLASERTATARALRDTRLLVFRRDQLERLEGIGRQAATNLMETIARVLALRLANMDRELADLCERLAERHVEVSDLVRQLGARRGSVMHEWVEADRP